MPHDYIVLHHSRFLRPKFEKKRSSAAISYIRDTVNNRKSSSRDYDKATRFGQRSQGSTYEGSRLLHFSHPTGTPPSTLSDTLIIFRCWEISRNVILVPEHNRFHLPNVLAIMFGFRPTFTPSRARNRNDYDSMM